MKDIVGIDFTAVEQYRESVSMKLTPTLTVELPLILGKDSAIADVLLRKADAVSARYALIIARARAMSDAAEKAEVSEVRDTTKDIDLLDKSLVESITELDKIAEINKQAQQVSEEVIKFIAPYLESITIDNGVKFVDRLQTLEPKWAIKILTCMLYGVSALDDEDDTMEKVEKEKEAIPTKK